MNAMSSATVDEVAVDDLIINYTVATAVDGVRVEPAADITFSTSSTSTAIIWLT